MVLQTYMMSDYFSIFHFPLFAFLDTLSTFYIHFKLRCRTTGGLLMFFAYFREYDTIGYPFNGFLDLFFIYICND